jgi:nucleotide-binding universal stress UspA family protein
MMPQFKHILFPVDFSERCNLAQPFVSSMARRFQAKVTLLHVIDIPMGWYGNIDTPYPLMLDIPAMVKTGEKQLASYLADTELSQIDRVVQHGHPATQITEFARQHNADLIAMPTHGYGKFRSLLLGSVTAKVLHDTDCAVWTAAHTEDLATADHLDCRSILCAIDLVPESADLIRYAVDLARMYDANLRLVHAPAAPEIHSHDPRDAEFRRNLMSWTRERIDTLQRQVGTDLEVCLEGGGVSNIVRGAALHYGADLVVIGRGKGQRSFGSLRTNSYAVICESPCPVLRV